MADENSAYSETNSMLATVSDLSDMDIVINYCLQNKIAKRVIDELLKKGFTSLEAFRLVEMDDLTEPSIPRGQQGVIVHIAAALQQAGARQWKFRLPR